MLLFLDVISPIPEFFIIEENKVIHQRKILKNESQKLSDHIVNCYTGLNKDLNLAKNIDKIIITVGPGSYTSLRVGAAFMSGLIISKKLEFCCITVEDIFNFNSKKYNYQDLGVFISSGNNQEFMCTMEDGKEIRYIKIEKNNYIFPHRIKKILYNLNKFKNISNELSQYKFTFIDEIINNINKLKFVNDTIIKPIYISNNQILN